MVDAFLAKKKEENPETYAAVNERYPTLSRHRYRVIYSRERTVGHLGLAPSHISPEVAAQYGLQSVYDEQEDDEE